MLATVASMALASTLAGGTPQGTAPASTPGTVTASAQSQTASTTGSAATTTYTVKVGDNLWKISQTTGASTASIVQINHLSNPNSLYIGETLQIPSTTNQSGSGSGSKTLPSATHSIYDLQVALADLGYLPLTHTLQWKYTNVPASLKFLWQPGANNVVTKGAVMAFQAANGLAEDGVAGKYTWQAINTDITNNRINPNGYSFVYVSNTTPFTLYLWHDGQYVLSTLANLGIPQSQTTLGTFPVYLQYQSQEMKGTNPDGTKYDDPGVQYVSYFYHGEAIHAFPRTSYGSQQSLGCVELPLAQAQTAWNYIHIGTLVTIDK